MLIAIFSSETNAKVMGQELHFLSACLNVVYIINPCLKTTAIVKRIELYLNAQ